MPSFPSIDDVRDLILLARREDMGLRLDDVTSRLLIAPDAVGVGTLVQKEPGITCGLPLVEMIARAYDERLKVEQIPGFHIDILEGRLNEQKRMPLLRLRGPMRSLLSAERVILNFLQHLGGVATLTHRFVNRVGGTKAAIYDTRKTIPGLRVLDKYAVRRGGGHNHRTGLYDGLLVKDNHLAGIAPRDLAAFLSPIIARGRGEDPGRMIEVEVENLDQYRELLSIDGIDIILLDNMDCPMMAEAVRLRDSAGRKGNVALEASGGVTLQTVREIAISGVDRIAVGALTHSAPALDLSMDVEAA